MNYEDLYQELQPNEKALKDGLSSLQKLFKAVSRETENGDIKNLKKDLKSMTEAASAILSKLESISDTVESFDAKTYFEGGDFAEQMLAFCKEKNVDVRGDFPVYEMFPYRIKVDTENQDLYLDRKKIPCIRPQTFVDMVKNGQEKLNKVPFLAAFFAAELASAYDLAILKLNKPNESDIYLTSLYKLLAPMSRFRKDYDQQTFAFDLARLYTSGIESTKNGRKFQFGPSRDQRKAIRILDKDGKERFLATIRFYE